MSDDALIEKEDSLYEKAKKEAHEHEQKATEERRHQEILHVLMSIANSLHHIKEAQIRR